MPGPTGASTVSDNDEAQGAEAALDALARLTKPLEWERRAGYRDSVAEGGLAAYVARWAAEVASRAGRASVSAAAQRINHALAGYPGLDTAGREAAVALAESLARQTEECIRTPDPPPVQEGRPVSRSPQSALSLRDAAQTDVQWVKGGGPVVAEKLAALGIRTVYDLLHYLPRRHEDRRSPPCVRDLAEGEVVGVRVRLLGAATTRQTRRMPVVKALARDDTGMTTLVWFNQHWVADRLRDGDVLIVSGRVSTRLGSSEIAVAEYEIEPPEGDSLGAGRIVPIYGLTSGLYQNNLRRAVRRALDQFATSDFDPVPAETRSRRRLVGYAEALRAAHYPATLEDIEASHRRLAYEELFVLETELASRRLGMTRCQAPPLEQAAEAVRELARALPYELTGAQKRVVRRIANEVTRPSPMQRLLHGDVGSGKTAVAMAAVLMAVRSGYQAALMAPTEILAEQHLRTLTESLGPLGVSVVLLTGAQRAGAKRRAHDEIAQHQAQVVVGTHALIQERVDFSRLGLAVIDEQHRFGVMQRARLMTKGVNPHTLVMTATPIPRTLAMTVYGDLDVSVLDEMPPGRQPVSTKTMGPRQAYALVRREVSRGRQAYVVCPLIEESETLDAEAAVALAERLRGGELAGIPLGLLHGRLPADEKDHVMGEFVAGQLSVLVSTTVIEVGVDVPNATVMVVENAERFGLAQLHQLRGRIGRGHHASYCALVCAARTAAAHQRVAALCRTSDGFAIAEEDLRLRGPGEYFGTKQSGLPDLQVADVIRDADLVAAAREDAFALVETDPGLAAPEHRGLAWEVELRMRGRAHAALVG